MAHKSLLFTEMFVVTQTQNLYGSDEGVYYNFGEMNWCFEVGSNSDLFQYYICEVAE